MNFCLPDCVNGVTTYETENMNSFLIMCTNSLEWLEAEGVCTSMSTAGHLTNPDNMQKNPSVERVVQQETEAITGWHGFSKCYNL